MFSQYMSTVPYTTLDNRASFIISSAVGESLERNTDLLNRSMNLSKIRSGVTRGPHGQQLQRPGHY